MQLQKGDALIVVDMQNDFVTGSLAVPGAKEIIEPVGNVIQKFIDQDLPVFFTACWHPENHCSFKEFGGPWPPHCIRETHGAELVEGISPLGLLVLKGTEPDKDAYSGFGSTIVDLHAELQYRQVSRLFIGGLATDFCVKETVLDGLRLGYTVVLLGDAIAAVNASPGAGSEALQAMYNAGALARDTAWVRLP